MFVAATCQLGRVFAFETTLMEPILAAPLPGGATLQAYVGKDTAAHRLYDTLYMDLIVTFIMTKNYGYSSLRKGLAQNQMGPGGQAYPTKLIDLVEMMNSKTPFKLKNLRKTTGRRRRRRRRRKRTKMRKQLGHY